MLFAADKYFTKSSLYKVLIINFFIKFIKSFVLVLFELFFSVIISSGLKRWFYEENTEYQTGEPRRRITLIDTFVIDQRYSTPVHPIRV